MSLLESARSIDSKSFNTKMDSIIRYIELKFSEPVELPSAEGNDAVVSDTWVILLESNIMNQVQIANLKKGGPTGWKLGKLVVDMEPAKDEVALHEFAEKMQRLE